MTVHNQDSDALQSSRLVARTAGLVTAVIVLLLCSCAAGERPSRLVQLCVRNDEGVSQFRTELKALASERHMKFAENGDEVRLDLEKAGYISPGQKKGDPVINITVEREDGLGLNALNVGLHTYQVAIGFSGGRDQAEGRQFAEEVIARLRQKWNVEDVPKGTGVLPSDTCR